MAKMRVHELAKEFGMTSKELLKRLEEMKIPAKNHASTLVDAYVDKIRKQLGPELAERAASIKAHAEEKAAEEAAEAERAKERDEASRKAAEHEERAARKEEIEERINEGRITESMVQAIAAEEPQATRVVAAAGSDESAPSASDTPAVAADKGGKPAKEATPSQQASGKPSAEAASEPATKAAGAPGVSVPARTKPAKPAHSAAKPQAAASAKPTAAPAESKSQAAAPASEPEKKAAAQKRPSHFSDLLAQIEHEKARIAQEAEEKKKALAQADQDKKEAARRDRQAQQPQDESPSHKASKPSRKNRSRGRGEPSPADEDEDRYKRMAKDVEMAQRKKVLEEARNDVRAAAAAAAGQGKRKKRKERRAAKDAEREQKRIEEAIARGEEIVDDSVVKVPTGSTVAEFAELLGVPANDVIKRLFLLGTPLTLTQSLDDELIDLVAEDLGRKVKVYDPDKAPILVFHDNPDDLEPRPPVVTVMGHVDHGKTSLLDAIRSTGVAENEAGGITQHIGASVVWINGQQITFIDTPGHEAFTAMRARGAKITDVVVLVVAADDGVMPQTIEAIHHAEAAEVPIIVAVNKIDKPGANPDRVREELTHYNIIPEEWGGQNMFVDVSAKKKLNIDELLETIILQAEVLELKANPNTTASGFVVEGKLDRGRGPVGTVLVNRGTLHVGDAVVCGVSHGRVRAMLDPKGNNVEIARPADPVEILGLSSVPEAGDEFQVFKDERDARDLAEERALKRRLAAHKRSHMSLDDLFERMKEGETTDLNLIVKADVAGSIEALQDALNKMDQSEVKINVIHSAVGGITETDVTLAAASDAIIIGFGVRPQPKAKTAAKEEKVDIRTYRVIYQAIEDINAARVGLLEPDEIEVETASIEVRDLFRVPKVGVIAGCYVTDGEISRNDDVRIVRNGTVIFEGHIASLRRFKDDVRAVKAGYECGIGIENYQDIKEGDIIEGYRIEEVKREA